MESLDKPLSQLDQSTEKPERKSKNILIVDDEKLFAFLLARLLRSRGYKASFVINAEKALSRLENEVFEHSLILARKK